MQEAIDTCPVSCIHWVTAPQLALLEETMSRMERVAAWLLVSPTPLSPLTPPPHTHTQGQAPAGTAEAWTSVGCPGWHARLRTAWALNAVRLPLCR